MEKFIITGKVYDLATLDFGADLKIIASKKSDDGTSKELVTTRSLDDGSYHLFIEKNKIKDSVVFVDVFQAQEKLSKIDGINISKEILEKSKYLLDFEIQTRSSIKGTLTRSNEVPAVNCKVELYQKQEKDKKIGECFTGEYGEYEILCKSGLSNDQLYLKYYNNENKKIHLKTPVKNLIEDDFELKPPIKNLIEDDLGKELNIVIGLFNGILNNRSLDFVTSKIEDLIIIKKQRLKESPELESNPLFSEIQEILYNIITDLNSGQINIDQIEKLGQEELNKVKRENTFRKNFSSTKKEISDFKKYDFKSRDYNEGDIIKVSLDKNTSYYYLINENKPVLIFMRISTEEKVTYWRVYGKTVILEKEILYLKEENIYYNFFYENSKGKIRFIYKPINMSSFIDIFKKSYLTDKPYLNPPPSDIEYEYIAEKYVSSSSPIINSSKHLEVINFQFSDQTENLYSNILDREIELLDHV
ncbi:MAG: hypothetical protein MI739_04820 [Bacteroidales bacterium]|nr:hypothetical protein [Bacteroidales bacterium]